MLRIVAFLIAAGPALLFAQSDVIRGKVSGADGQPIDGARITVTGFPSQLTKQTRTDKKGAYQAVFPSGDGSYIVGVSAIGHTYKQLEVKRTADQDILIGDVKLQPILLDVVTSVANAPQSRVTPGAITPDIGGTERSIALAQVGLEAYGNLAAMAASVPGVQLLPGVDGMSDGFSVFGLGADQNNTMFNGLNFGGGNLPRDASFTTSLVTSSYDVSRGGYSGGQMNVTMRGTYGLRRIGFNTVFSSPATTWTDRAGSAVGAEATNVSAGGIYTRHIIPNAAFMAFSYQLGRRSNDLRSLLSTNNVGLQSAGVAGDSVGRLVDILQNAGINPSAGGVGNTRSSNNGSTVLNYSYTSPTAASGLTYGLTGTANWQRDRAQDIGTSSLPSSGGDRSSVNAGLQARHSIYWKLVLSETNIGVNMGRSSGSPYLVLPSGRVRVSSTLEDGENSVRNLAFGGAPSLSARATNLNGSLNNALSWFSDDNKHRLKLTTDLRYEHSRADQSNNLLGTFTFNSLADLENGIPATYTRQLTARERTTGGLNGSVSLGDSYRHNPDLQFQYGVRVDGTRFDHRPTYNAAVDSIFGVRNDAVPQRLYVSPRIGFSWTVGTAPQIGAFEGAVRGPRAIVRGGIGVFQNASSAGLISSALENTGLPSGVQQLYCIGAAAPKPDWAAYERDPLSAPSQCADGSAGSVFSSTAPNVSLIDAAYQASRRVSSNLSWSGRVLGNRFSANIEGTVALNLHQSRTIDMNFQPIERFALANEANRPVFVQTTSIAPTSGVIAVRDARVTSAFTRVNRLTSDLRGTSQQLTVSLSPVYTVTPRFTWSGSYTFLHGREQVSGFANTVGNPLDVFWAPISSGVHQINYNLGYNVRGYVSFRWTGSYTSGRPFTPMVGGDVNGDGSGGNDRAFVFDPTAAGDPAVTAAMSDLLARSDRRARSCLQKQLGKLASRNSCGTPWSTNGSLGITLDPVKLRMPPRARLQMSVSNPLGAADLLVNGSGNLKGWGAGVTPDQTLLYVRGFDADSRTYQYEVNQRFGATRPALITLRSPVTMTFQVNIDLGPTTERQNLETRLDIGRVLPGSKATEALLKSMMTSGAIPNPFLTIIANQDSLKLTVAQSDSIAAMSRRFTYRVDSLWTPVIRDLAGFPDDYSHDEAFKTYLRGRIAALDLLESLGGAVKALLTAEQRRKLPATVTSALDPAYLASIRYGFSTYLR